MQFSLQVAGNQSFLSKGGSGRLGGWQLMYLNANSDVYFFGENGAGAVVGSVISTANITLNTWTTTAIVTDRASYLDIYYDGLKTGVEAGNIYPPLATNIDKSDEELFIGNSNTLGLPFTGSIKSIYLAKYAFTPTQINQIYTYLNQ